YSVTKVEDCLGFQATLNKFGLGLLDVDFLKYHRSQTGKSHRIMKELSGSERQQKFPLWS
ncbi:MAG TPA: hypothetical protein PLS70_19250, partial [Acidobacteriota bacterium]|nr:hypothetical protein [Acidobacteriota bacterium]HNB73265.1 hypothetical protein [Acidobacteriota bacterium]